MSNVVSLFPNAKVSEALRNIAQALDDEVLELEGTGCTVVLGKDVFHLGCVDDAIAAGDAIFNMTFGIQKLMRPVVDWSMEERQ